MNAENKTSARPAGPVPEAREWISALAQDPIHVRTVITATGVLGDPHAVNWLITKMADPLFARLAGEAFTHITGIDLMKHELNKDPPHDTHSIPTDAATTAHAGMDEDENLPWPDVNKIAALWRHHGAGFTAGQRYFLGKPITVDGARRVIDEGAMRQRHAAALDLALLDTQRPLVNTRARAMYPHRK